jgi:hypothetical protein
METAAPWKNQPAIFPPFPLRLENSPHKTLRVSHSSHNSYYWDTIFRSTRILSRRSVKEGELGIQSSNLTFT